MKAPKIVYLFIILISHNPIFSQTISHELLDKLNIALFPKTDSMISIEEVYKCEMQVIDSLYSIRESQPNSNEVLNILEAISFTKDTAIISSLLEIYKQQIKYFKKEWYPVIHTNFYPCDCAIDQFKILSGFEETLLSLHLNTLNLSPFEKYNLCKERERLDYRFIIEKSNRVNIQKKYKYFLPEYSEMKKQSRFAPEVNYQYLTPYLDEIAPFFIEEFLNFRFDSLNTTHDYELQKFFVTYACLSYMKQMRGKEVEAAIMSQFEHWGESPYLSWLYSVVGIKKRSKAFLEFLVEQSISNPKCNTMSIYQKGYLIRKMCYNSDNANTIQDYFIFKLRSKNTEERQVSAQILQYFRTKETVKAFKKYKFCKLFSKEERKLAKNIIDSIENPHNVRHLH